MTNEKTETNQLATAYLIGAEHMREKLHKQAEVIEAQAKRIAELEDTYEQVKEELTASYLCGYERAKSELSNRIDELEAALKPFAAVYDENYALIGKWHDGGIQGLFLSDLRAARKVLDTK